MFININMGSLLGVQHRAYGLNLLVAAAILWNTRCLAEAFNSLDVPGAGYQRSDFPPSANRRGRARRVPALLEAYLGRRSAARVQARPLRRRTLPRFHPAGCVNGSSPAVHRNDEAIPGTRIGGAQHRYQ
jgi:hypothetical protein